MGGMIGGSVGLVMGFIFGGYSIVRYGAGQNGMMRTLGQYMLGSAATFGFFMSIGSAIRADGSPMTMETYMRAQRTPVILPARHLYASRQSVEKERQR